MKTKKLDWTKTIQNSVNRQIDLITIFYSLKTPQDLEKLLTQQRAELLEEIKKICDDYDYKYGRFPESQFEGESVWEYIEKFINLLNKKDDR